VIFDWDDHAENNDALPWMLRLEEINPAFKATLFSVPALGSEAFWNGHPDWIELAGHGWAHPTPREAERWSYEQSMDVLLSMPDRFAEGYKLAGFADEPRHVPGVGRDWAGGSLTSISPTASGPTRSPSTCTRGPRELARARSGLGQQRVERNMGPRVRTRPQRHRVPVCRRRRCWYADEPPVCAVAGRRAVGVDPDADDSRAPTVPDRVRTLRRRSNVHRL